MKWISHKGVLKWAVVTQSYKSNNPNKLNLLVGDDVYIIRHCAGWYYGFKASGFYEFGVFPKKCVTFRKVEAAVGVNAELQMMFARLVTMFVSGSSSTLLDSVYSELLTAVDLKYAFDRKVAMDEFVTGLKLLITQMAICHNSLSLPLTVRNESFNHINLHNTHAISLHQQYEHLIKEVMSPQSNNTDLFSLLVRIRKHSLGQLTVYLASQSVQSSIVELAPVSDHHIMAFGQDLPDNIRPNIKFSFSSSPAQEQQVVRSLMRLTEDLTIDNGDRECEIIFKDLEQLNPNEKRTLLLLTATRHGPLLTKRSKPSNNVKRPLGVGCLDITHVLKPYFERNFGSQKQTNDYTNHKCAVNIKLINNEQFLPEALSRAISETPFSLSGAHSCALTDQQQQSAEFPRLEIDEISILPCKQLQSKHSNAIVVNRFGFVQYPTGLTRNELYVALLSGSFYKGNKAREHNVEVEVTLRDSLGRVRCFQNSSSPIHASTVYYHKSQPNWCEFFVVKLPMNDRNSAYESSDSAYTESSFSAIHCSELADLHLRFLCRHRSSSSDSNSKILGVAYLRIQPNSFVPNLLSDGTYQLYVHKMESSEIDACAYLNNRSYNEEFSAGSNNSLTSKGTTSSSSFNNLNLTTNSFLMHNSSRNRQDVISVHTLLCSTTYTSDDNITKVLLWQNYQEELATVLEKGICFSRKDVELRKFFIPLIDSMFQILQITVNPESKILINESLGHSVLKSLARCYQDLTINPECEKSFRSYLTSHNFMHHSIHYSYMCLLNSIMHHVIEQYKNSRNFIPNNEPPNVNSSITDNSCESDSVNVKTFCLIFSTIDNAFLSITHSRQAELKRNRTLSGDNNDHQFDLQVQQFFNIILKLIQCADYASIESNTEMLLTTSILKAVPQIIKPLLNVYPTSKLSQSVVSLIECTAVYPALFSQKILSATISSALFDVPESRHLLLVTIQSSLRRFLTQKLEKSLVEDQSGNTASLDSWCQLFLLFVENFHTVVNPVSDFDSEMRPFSELISANSFTPLTKLEEVFLLLVKHKFLRWTVQQYAKILIFIDEQAHSVDENEINLPTDSESSIKFPKYEGRTLPDIYRVFRPVIACFSTALFTFVGMISKPLWTALIKFYATVSEKCDCHVCTDLHLVDLFDITHEILSLFTLMHLYPAYPVVSFIHSNGMKQMRLGRFCWDEKFGQRNLPVDFANNRNYQNQDGKITNQTWLEMLIFISNSELNVISMIIEMILKPYFINKSDNPFNMMMNRKTGRRLSAELINLTQKCLVSFAVDQTHLFVEDFPALLRVHIVQDLTDQCTDMRYRACDMLISLWKAFDDTSKEKYIHFFLPAVICMATLPLHKIRTMCVEFILESIKIHSKLVERIFVSEIDQTVHRVGTAFAAALRELFLARYPDLINTVNAETIDRRRKKPISSRLSTNDQCQLLVLDFCRQISCLLTYCKSNDHSSQLSEMLALYELREFYESIGREDMTLRYLYRLEQLHETYQNHIEQGYTLELISGHYKWDEEPADVSDVSSVYVAYGWKSSRVLREHLLLKSLDCLQKGSDWEHAIEVSDQLIHLYRDVKPNYIQLNKILQCQATLYANIVSSDSVRMPNNYYLLTFTGQLNEGYKQQFIYRTINSFSEVNKFLEKEFPQAEVLYKHVPADELRNTFTITSNGNLSPEADVPDYLRSHGVDSRIKGYYARNCVKCFTCHRVSTSNKTDKRNDTSNMEETRYCISKKMPNIVPIMPVISSETRILSSTEWANIQVVNMLDSLKSKFTDCQVRTSSVTHLIGQLNSSISSPVSGGLIKLMDQVELSDDPAQERYFSRLSDSVLELLELQLTIMEYLCNQSIVTNATANASTSNHNITNQTHTLTSSNQRARISESNSTEAETLLPLLIPLFDNLARDMSRKFGFSINHLSTGHLQYGATKPISDRPTSRTQAVTRMNTTHKPHSNLSQSRIFYRPDWSEEDTFRENHGTGDINSVANIISSEPPALPDRPSCTKASIFKQPKHVPHNSEGQTDQYKSSKMLSLHNGGGDGNSVVKTTRRPLPPIPPQSSTVIYPDNDNNTQAPPIPERRSKLSAQLTNR